MEYQLSSTSMAPLVEISLDNNEEIQIESGSMVYHNAAVKLEGKMNSNGKGGLGGALSALGRSITSGESFFITKASAIGENGKISLAPASLGSIKEIFVGPEQWKLNTGAFLASEDGVHYVMERQKLSGALFGGTGGFFVMKTQGRGTMLISGYGDIVEIALDGTEDFVVDNQHVLAWTDSLSYSINVASGLFGFTTGEGLVNTFRGKGRIMIQSRNVEALAQLIIPYLPRNNNN
jgi:uncharacterized protein (TIGR00266 family)